MKRRFVVATANLTPDIEKAFVDHLTSRGVLWWHWLPNFWLLIDSGDEVDAKKLRDFFMEKRKDCLAMEFEDDLDWQSSGGEISDEKFMTDWLRKHWND